MAAQETMLVLFSSVSRWRYAFELGYRQTAPTGSSPDEPFIAVNRSFTIIELKGGVERSTKKPDQSSNPTGAPAGIP